MVNKLIVLTSDEELRKRAKAEYRRIARSIDDEAIDTKGIDKIMFAPISEEQARLIMSQLTPTFWADYSFDFRDYVGQVNVYQKLEVTINRRELAA